MKQQLTLVQIIWWESKERKKDLEGNQITDSLNNSTLLLKFYHFHVSKIFTSVSGLFFPRNEGV